MKALIPSEHIEQQIYLIRGHRVMVDSDLARIYGVSTIRLNQQVRRNHERFPGDFVFQMTKGEAESLRLQNAISKPGRGGRRYLPYVFTEHGALAAAFVLNSPVAVAAGIQIVRIFNRLRQLANTHKDLALALAKLEKIEHKVTDHDEQIQEIFDTIREIMTPPKEPPKQIGFRLPESGNSPTENK